jgi:hypothetical protein
MLAACVTPGQGATQPDPTLRYARFGQTIAVGGARVTPLSLIEDSRCPASVTCVWRGQVRITARIVSARGNEVRELTSGKAIEVAGGMLELADVRPPRRTPAAIPVGTYRLGLRFSR